MRLYQRRCFCRLSSASGGPCPRGCTGADAENGVPSPQIFRFNKWLISNSAWRWRHVRTTSVRQRRKIGRLLSDIPGGKTGLGQSLISTIAWKLIHLSNLCQYWDENSQPRWTKTRVTCIDLKYRDSRRYFHHLRLEWNVHDNAYRLMIEWNARVAFSPKVGVPLLPPPL